MAEKRVGEVTEANFDQDVLQAERPVLVDFWAPWCAPCHLVSPLLEELSLDFDTKVTFLKMNVDDNQSIASRYSIRAIPTLLVFKGGEVVEQVVGVVPKTQLESMLRKVAGD
jgi:thioredoxin 1